LNGKHILFAGGIYDSKGTKQAEAMARGLTNELCRDAPATIDHADMEAIAQHYEKQCREVAL
jgi:hypothetical protein